MIVSVSEVSLTCNDGAADVYYYDTDKLDLTDEVNARFVEVIKEALASKYKSIELSYDDAEDFETIDYAHISVDLPQLIEGHVTLYRP